MSTLNAQMEVASNHYVVRNLRSGLRVVREDRIMLACLGFLGVVVLLAIIAPSITPYEYDEYVTDDQGRLLQSAPPSLAHPLGTTTQGQDVLSRIIYGARPTAITGLVSGTLLISIGMTIGVTAGFVGGRVEDVLMRFTDMAFGVPLIPFAIVLLTLFGIGFWTSITVVGLILWRGNARVLRAQVLQIKERPYVQFARATGASTPRILVKNIIPHIAPMAVLFYAIGTGYAILLQASLAFIGVSNPFVPSWGIMIRNAYNSGQMANLWWWTIPPGVLVSLTVLSLFMVGRKYEEVAGVEGAVATGG